MSEREILFRGKFGDEWKYGYVSPEPDGLTIKEPYVSKQSHIWYVNEDTIGAYTGLTDKNGTRIFEGDIVKITGFHTTAIAAVKYGSTSEKSTHWGWYFDDNDGHTYFLMSKAFCEDYNAIIIGNIHDNPKLLEGE